MNRRVGVVVVACLLLACPAVAAANTKTVTAGEPPSVTKTFENKYGADVNDFFLHKVTINKGDSVKFVIAGFHTVDIPAKGGSDLPLLQAGPTVTGVNDAAGSPFWFDGKVPSLGFNPVLASQTTSASYDGSTRVDSGLPLTPKPLLVTFTKPGVYKYFCDVHPGMVGQVVVLPKTSKAPTKKQDAAALAQQIKLDLKSAKKLDKTKVHGANVSLGESDSHGVEVYAMFPATLKVKTGTVVTFSMSTHTREVHTASFGPVPYLMPIAKSFNSPAFDQRGVYPSDNPALGPISESPTSHGNGFANTGVLDQDASTPLPSSGMIAFTAPGTYHFVCLIHPFMHGTIIVH